MAKRAILLTLSERHSNNSIREMLNKNVCLAQEWDFLMDPPIWSCHQSPTRQYGSSHPCFGWLDGVLAIKLTSLLWVQKGTLLAAAQLSFCIHNLTIVFSGPHIHPISQLARSYINLMVPSLDFFYIQIHQTCPLKKKYHLVMTNIAMENHHF